MIGMRSHSKSPRAAARLVTLMLGGGVIAFGGCGIEDALDGDPPATVSGGGTEEGVFVGVTEAHNAARQELGASPPLGDLEWSEELATFAQQWADSLAQRCGTIEHRNQNRFGENIALRGSTRGGGSFAG